MEIKWHRPRPGMYISDDKRFEIASHMSHYPYRLNNVTWSTYDDGTPFGTDQPTLKDAKAQCARRQAIKK